MPRAPWCPYSSSPGSPSSVAAAMARPSPDQHGLPFSSPPATSYSYLSTCTSPRSPRCGLARPGPAVSQEGSCSGASSWPAGDLSWPSILAARAAACSPTWPACLCSTRDTTHRPAVQPAAQPPNSPVYASHTTPSPPPHHHARLPEAIPTTSATHTIHHITHSHPATQPAEVHSRTACLLHTYTWLP